MAIEKKKGEAPLYIQLYEYYKELILQGGLRPGEKLPSIRRCALERQLSKTTVENSYMQLCAEGYIQSRGGSGFYVSELELIQSSQLQQVEDIKNTNKIKIEYDFISSSVDKKSFAFDMWRRYMKSALRKTDRLLAYGDTQGELDLRIAIRNYIKETRGIVCSEEQIVIGAGSQSLLNILCALTNDRKSICFTGNGFKQGEAVFDDRSYKRYYKRQVASSFSFFKEKHIKMIYVSPSHMTPWGEVMPLRMRTSLLKFASKEDCLIIEDDYDSEFRYFKRPVPALQSLDGGKKVIYLGSFSRLLLPSLRIGFMVLPLELLPRYQKIGYLYNQTASTAEQIALCQFITDGHLKKQIKRARKLYTNKAQALCNSIKIVFGDKAKAITKSVGFLVRVEIVSNTSAEQLVDTALEIGVRIRSVSPILDHPYPCILFSCSGIDEDDFIPVMRMLKQKWLDKGYLG